LEKNILSKEKVNPYWITNELNNRGIESNLVISEGEKYLELNPLPNRPDLFS
jgi:hypothetical protein